MEIKRVPISSVILWDKNPRGIKTKDFARLKKQILKLGVYKPLIAFEEKGKYVVLGGNMRIRALKDMDLKEVDISVVTPKTEAEKIEFALSDNDRVGFYQEDQLAELVYPHIKDIELGDFKVDLGEAIDLKQVVERFGPDIEDGADEVPEVDDSPAITKPGDLFMLGKHRLLCGDSTKAEDVARLMRGEKAALCLTDPPYGINIVRGGRASGVLKGRIGGRGKVAPRIYSTIIGDDKPFDPKHLLSLGDVQIIFGAHHFADKLPISAGWIVWDKGVAPDSSFSKAELAWVNTGGHVLLYRHTWSGLVRAGSREEELKDRVHPTQKPVGLFVQILEDFPGEGVIDPYIGSGTTLIAAEKTGRVCYGMEIDPKYCDVIIKRYADYISVDEASIRKTREKANG